MLELNQIHCMDCIEGIKQMDAESVNCCATSPPYWGLRDYGVAGQLGVESTPEEYVKKMVDVFREVKRVLRKDGTLWLNLGDSYCGTGSKRDYKDPKYAMGRNGQSVALNNKIAGIKSKDLVGIPWMVAFALRTDGWYLRSDIIWSKPNCMPESVTDRPTRCHEYIFLFSKSSRYYYDAEAIKEPIKGTSVKRLSQNITEQQGSDRANGGGKTNGAMKAVCFGGNKRNGGSTYSGKPWIPQMAGGAINIDDRKQHSASGEPYITRNKRSVWEVSTASFSEAHFATFPPKLIEPCILAGCPISGTVLDPFMGAGTTALVAKQWQRNFIVFELNQEYCNIASKRIQDTQLRIGV